jgi:nucleoside-diphosphate-sugar epimerase
MQERVFITGITGYLGSAIGGRLQRAGCEVHGLTRNAERAPGLEAAGIHAVVGDLAAPDSYLGILKNCDAVVHTALDSAGGPAVVDQRALETFRQAAQDGRIRRLLYTSGVWVYGDTGDAVLDESSERAPLDFSRWRAAHEDFVLDMVDHEMVPVILRPGIVYGEWRGILGPMFAEARDRRSFSYPGDGSQYWPLVHRDDVAEAYALALEHAKAGDVYFLVDGSHHTVREVAEAIASTTGATAVPWPTEEVVTRLGPYGRALLASQRFDALRARRDLGWVPRHTSFVKDAAALQREWEDSRAPAR